MSCCLQLVAMAGDRPVGFRIMECSQAQEFGSSLPHFPTFPAACVPVPHTPPPLPAVMYLGKGDRT